MRNKARLLGLFGATTIASSCLAAAPASAQDASLPVSDSIIFQGCTPANGVVPPLPIAGGSGNYAFGAPCPSADQFMGWPGFCEAFSDLDLPDILNTPNEIGPCAFFATGTYSFAICGTGMTGGGTLAGLIGFGTDTASLDAEGVAPYATIEYGASFVAGVGVIGGVVFGSSAAAGDDDTGGLVGGQVILTPTNGSCLTQVTQFYATGHAYITEPEAGS